MIRRILLAQLGLLLLILLGTVLPLGVATAAADRQTYVDSATSAARSLAAVVEENVDDGRADPTLPGQLSHAARAGDAVELVNRDGAVLARAGDLSAGGALLRRALAGRSPVAWYGEGGTRRLAVAVPVGGRTPAVAAVLLVRPARPIEDAVARLWLRLATLTALATLAAAVVALALARWVGGPVLRLEAAAGAFGYADLGARANTVAGPSEVRRLADTFNTMAARLQMLVHRQQSVIADVSHQLRTPLAAIRLRLELLADETSDSHVGAEVGGALAELGRLSRLVDGMLAVARAEHSARPPEPVRVDRVVDERVSAWQPVAEEAGVAMVSDVAGELTATMTDGHLEQVLDNLLDNSITATPAGGTVAVRAAYRAGQISIVISDDGPGMTARQQADAFHRFAGDRDGGSGLGLAIVHRLITTDRGTAELGSAPSGGLAVTLQLPAAARVAGAADRHLRQPR